MAEYKTNTKECAYDGFGNELHIGDKVAFAVSRWQGDYIMYIGIIRGWSEKMLKIEGIAGATNSDKPADWDKVLDQFDPPYTNYSQLGGIEINIDDFHWNGYENAISEWIDTMIEGGVQDTPENREILTDIFKWVADNYESILLGWRDDVEAILDYVKDMNKDKTMWALSEEDYVTFMIAKKKLSGNDKKLGEVVAKYGDSGEVVEIAAEYA